MEMLFLGSSILFAGWLWKALLFGSTCIVCRRHQVRYTPLGCIHPDRLRTTCTEGLGGWGIGFRLYSVGAEQRTFRNEGKANSHALKLLEIMAWFRVCFVQEVTARK